MIRIYMLCDPASRPHQLTTFIKAWAKARSIKDSSADTLSSYAYTLLVVFYLQRRGIVPCLQAPGLIDAYERWRGCALPPVKVNGHVIRYCGDEVFIRGLTEARIASGQYCHENLGSLVVGFFEYYTRVFDWDNCAVSIRLGRPMPRDDWPDAAKNRIGIEDPFEEGRDVCVTLGGRNQRYKGQIRIFNEMVRAREMLQTGLCGSKGEARDSLVATTMERLLAPPFRGPTKGGKSFKKPRKGGRA
jgi:terminal uridylyltransferase